MKKNMENINNNQEKEILEKIRVFTEELEKKKKELLSQEIIKEIKYYEEFNLDKLKFEDVYVVVLEDEEKDKISEVYLENPNKKIIRMNKKIEELAIDENIQKVLDSNKIGQEEVKEYIENLNEENLRVKTEIVSKEKMEKELNNRENQEQNENNKMNNEEKKKQMSKDLGEDLEISYYKEIIDDRVRVEFPEICKNASEIGVAYSKKLNSFICVAKTDKGFRIAEGTTPSRPTMRTIISIDKRGEKVEEKIPHAIINTKDANKDISIDIGDYGAIQVEKVDRTVSNNRIGRQLDSKGESYRTTKEVKDLTQTKNIEGNRKLDDMAENYKENSKIGDKVQTTDDIQRNDEWTIDLEDGKQIIIADEAKKAKVSVEEFKQFYLEAEGETPEEKIENAHEDIEEYYRHPNKKR